MTISIICIVLAAICNAVMDKIAHHYSASIFAKFGDWWNPSVSWKLKYKNYPTDQRARFLFSKTALVFLTDAWHFFQFLMFSFFIIAIIVPYVDYLQLPIWYGIAAFAALKIILGGVFELFYSKLFKRKGNAQ